MKKGKNRGEGGRDGWKKLLSIALTVALITTTIAPREVEASWFSDICGGAVYNNYSTYLDILPRQSYL